MKCIWCGKEAKLIEHGNSKCQRCYDIEMKFWGYVGIFIVLVVILSIIF